MLSTQVTKLNYLTLTPTQHYNFFRNLRLFINYIVVLKKAIYIYY